MNCANHPENAAVAYCRTCGKPVCAQCTRDVHGVIYCESCLADRLQVAAPPGMGSGQIPAGGGPNPALAGILSGLFPFGVGAVYNGQYSKGLVHLLVFVLLIVGMSSGGGTVGLICALGMAFFYFYQIIDAARTARSLQLGQPAPDPMGIAQIFGTWEKPDTSKVPVGALVLIGLGVLFLLNTLDDFQIGVKWLLPIFLLSFGMFVFARRFSLVGTRPTGCQCDRCRTRNLMGPVLMIAFAILWMISNVHELSFAAWVGILLIIFGGITLLENNASDQGHNVAVPPISAPVPTEIPQPAPQGEQGTAPTEVKNG
jgi:hypothetical protein